MMIGSAPEFTKSEYFENQPVWRLKEGASSELKGEFEKFMNAGNVSKFYKKDHPEMENPYYLWTGEIVDKVRNDAVERFRQRRKARLDAKEEEGRWVTTEEDHRIHINAEGVPDKGNPYVLKAMQSGDREGYEKRRSKRRIDKAKAIVVDIDKASLNYRTAKKAAQKAHQIAHLAERVDDGIKADLERLEAEGIKKGDKHKLESELEEVKQKLGEVSYRCSADLVYRESHMQEERDLAARKNQLDYLINCYESAYEDKYALAFPDNKFVSLADARKAVQKAEKDEADAEKRLEEKTRLLSEQSQKADKQRLYTAGERADAVKEIEASKPFQGLSEAGRQKMSQTIESMPDAQLAILRKTAGGCVIRDSEGAYSSTGADSYYRAGTGAIFLEKGDMEVPRIVLHEYGHYLDDQEMSGCGMGKADWGYSGSEYTRKFSDVLQFREVLHGNSAAKDIQGLMGDKGKVKSSGSDLIVIESSGENADSGYWDFGEMVTKKLGKFISKDEEFEEYKRSIGMPSESESPKYYDYFETYTTPKRGLVRTRERYKGASDEWSKARDEWRDKYDAAFEAHREEYLEKYKEAEARQAEREQHVAPVSDILCGLVRGKGPFIYGSHSPNYYAYSEKPAEEAAANYHQMRSMGWTDSLDLLKSLVPSVAKGLEEAYDEWLWRNI